MVFIIGGKKYDTDKMEKVADVKKWYRVDNIFSRALYGEKEVGRYYKCELWRSNKGNWLLTHECDYAEVGEAISESEAKGLLLRYAPDKYEELFEEIPEA